MVERSLKDKRFFGLIAVLAIIITLIYMFCVKPNLMKLTSKKRSNILDTYKGKWIVLMVLNRGYFDFYENWARHYEKLATNLPRRLFAEDEVSFKLLNNTSNDLPNILVEKSRMEPINETVKYNSKLFNNLATRRFVYILDTLERGIHVIYSDTDAVWLQDPVPFFTGNYDLWIQTDGGTKNLCTGFMALKSNNRSINFVRKMKDTLKGRPAQVNQPVFNSLDPMKHMNVKILDTKYFPSGLQYFNQYNKEKRNSVVVVHNNYIVSHDAKLNRFKRFNLWKA